MLIGLNWGSSARQYSIRSVARRRDGSGGKMYVPRAMYSLRMSFWTVPRSFSGPTPWRRPTASYRASRMAAVALIVIEVLTDPRSIPANRRAMSWTVSMGTPTRPTSPATRASSLS